MSWKFIRDYLSNSADGQAQNNQQIDRVRQGMISFAACNCHRLLSIHIHKLACTPVHTNIYFLFIRYNTIQTPLQSIAFV